MVFSGLLSNGSLRAPFEHPGARDNRGAPNSGSAQGVQQHVHIRLLLGGEFLGVPLEYRVVAVWVYIIPENPSYHDYNNFIIDRLWGKSRARLYNIFIIASMLNFLPLGPSTTT